MKILAVADIHGAQYRLNTLLDNIEKYSPDLVVICGDITQFGPGAVAKNFLNQIPVETLAIPGNIDTPDVGKSILESKAENIDLKKVFKNNISFIGIGGETISSEAVILDKGHKKPIEERIKDLQENQEKLMAMGQKMQNEATELSQKTQQMMDNTQQ